MSGTAPGMKIAGGTLYRKRDEMCQCALPDAQANALEAGDRFECGACSSLWVWQWVGDMRESYMVWTIISDKRKK